MKHVLLCLAMLLPPAAFAHHGWSEYDAGRTLTLDGTIVESAYDNPHTVVRLKTADKTWVAVLAPPFRMEARGLKSEAIKPGLKARVVGYPNRTRPDEMRAERIVIDGKTVELR
ncbi:MAG: hypothetical protein JNM90_19115 [Burkholderiales bacterium]|nr:hypothetical protein [Burkholderiales bacterium]